MPTGTYSVAGIDGIAPTPMSADFHGKAFKLVDGSGARVLSDGSVHATCLGYSVEWCDDLHGVLGGGWQPSPPDAGWGPIFDAARSHPAPPSNESPEPSDVPRERIDRPDREWPDPPEPTGGSGRLEMELGLGHDGG